MQAIRHPGSVVPLPTGRGYRPGCLLLAYLYFSCYPFRMIRIIGRNKCNDTKKALRFFKERGIKVQFQNLDERELTAGELGNIFKLLKPDTLLDTESKEYKKRGMAYMDFDTPQELLEDQLLLKTPIIILGRNAMAGFDQNFCKQLVESAK